ncbi:MAG: LPS export ABC transporter permease LptF [Methylohalobius sp.]|nr:LPS export ABC transporter permease LptF [Methylohalobius sp.]
MSLFRFLLLDRYLAREVLRPFAATCSLFVLLFGGYSSAKLLADAVAGLLPTGVVWQLIGLKIVIALEVLLPIALYLAMVIGLGRLYSDSEMVAMAACGYGEGRIAWTVLRLALLVAVVVAGFSLQLRPWAYRQSYELENRAKAGFDVHKLEARRFHVGQDYVVFAEEVDRPGKRLHQVFFNQELSNRKTQIIYARSLTQGEPDSDGNTPLIFEEGYAYELDFEGRADISLRFKQLILVLNNVAQPPGYRSKSASTWELWDSEDFKDVAELQWRLSRPSSTLLLALLAVPLSRTAPRAGRYGRTILAVLVFAVYYNLAGLAKTWVKEGAVGAMPGLWWVDTLLLGLIGVFYFPLVSAWFRLHGKIKAIG